MASTINVKIAPLPRGDYSSSATYAKLDVVSYNGSSYMAIKAVPTGTAPTNTTYWQLLAATATIPDGSISTSKLADGAVTLAKLDSSVSDKYAEVSGTYEDMVVGSAEQLLSTQYDTDSVPYAFRKSPYGDREFDEIVGGSIAWNQLIDNGNFASSDGWETYNCTFSVSNGIATITPTASLSRIDNQTPVVLNHKYLVSASFKGTNGAGNALLSWYGGVTKLVPFDGTWQSIGVVWDNTFQTNNFWHVQYGSANNSESTSYQITNATCIDLTQMFGSTVADAIYAMEQSTVGSGVAFFRGLFPKPYYAYNAGQLISVTGLTAHKTTGFNQFGSTLTFGNIDSSGADSGTDARYVRTVGYTKALPNTGYCFYADSTEQIQQMYLIEYDANNTLIARTALYSGSALATSRHEIFTTHGNTQYIRAFVFKSSAYTSADNVRFCINISDATLNGTYIPYESHTYPLDSDLVLRGVPKLVNNKVQFDGDVYSSDGTVQREWGEITYDGSADESWDLQSINSSGIANFRINNAYNETKYLDAIRPNAITNRFEVQTTGISSTTTEGFMLAAGTVFYIRISSSTANTVAAFKTWLSNNPVTLVYPLATPTTESASPYVNPQINSEYGTEEYVSAEQSGVTMIVGHNTKYPQNLRKKIEGLPWNFSSLIAPTEVTNKATRNYTVGSYLIMNNTLYKVTSAIANGGTITVGTNVTATTIMAEILAL